MSSVRKKIIFAIAFFSFFTLIFIFFSLSDEKEKGDFEDDENINSLDKNEILERETREKEKVQNINQKDNLPILSNNNLLSQNVDISKRFPSFDDIRMQIFLTTDKDIYKPGDIIHIRGLLLNTFTNEPIQEKKDVDGKWKITIKNGIGVIETEKEFDIDEEIRNGLVYAHKISKNAKGGEYEIKIELNSYSLCATAGKRKINIRTFIQPRFNKNVDFDRSGYIAGDTVTAFCSFERVEGGDISKKAEVIATVTVDGNEIFYKRYSLNNGLCNIEFVLPSYIFSNKESFLSVTIQEGISETFTKTIPLLVEDRVNLKIFPEGGNLVKGLSNGVFLECLDFDDNEPIDFTARLIDEKGETIEEITSIHEGRAFFTFLFEEKKKYFIVLDKPITQTFELENYSIDKGISMILKSKSIINEGNAHVSFILHSTNDCEVDVVFYKKEKIIGSMEKIKLLKGKEIPVEFDIKTQYKGVFRMTLFHNNIPTLERLFFVYSDKSLQFNVKSNQDYYEPQDEVVLSIESYVNDLPEKSFFSVIVTDDSVYKMKEERKRQPRILPLVLLENEVEILNDANSYFEDTDLDSTYQEKMDLLLGTQGWRKFVYFKMDEFIEDVEGHEKEVILLNYSPNFDTFRMKFQFDMMENDDVVFLKNEAGKGDMYYSTIARVFTKPIKSHDLSVRSEFDNTIFFAVGLETSQKNKHLREISFYLNDAITTYRVFVEGYTKDGILGYNTNFLIHSKKPVFMECKVSSEIIRGDIMHLPCLIANNLPKKMDLTLIVESEYGDVSVINYPKKISLDEEERKNIYVSIDVSDTKIPESSIIFSLERNGIVLDKLKRTIRANPPGLPLIFDFGGILSRKKGKKISLNTPNTIVEGSLQTFTKVYSTPVSTLTESVSTLIREPFGCFEQTSNVVYPMVIALKYLSTHRDDKKSDDAVLIKANEMIKKGLDKLLSYECTNGGFEWFGEDPAHEALTSMGIKEFKDMLEVFSDNRIQGALDRAISWLLTRINKNSTGFEHNSKSLDSFGYAPKYISDMYIMWAISGTMKKDSLPSELEKVLESLINDGKDLYEDDSYFQSLLGLTLFNFGLESEAFEVTKKLVSFHDVETGIVKKSKTSITSSRGDNLDVETTALASMNFMNFYDDFLKECQKSMKFILNQNKNGRFGTTQATVLALRAIVTFDEKNSKSKNDGIAKLLINGEEFNQKIIKADNDEPIIFDNFNNKLIIGSVNEIELILEEMDEIPFSLQVSMKTLDVSLFNSTGILNFEVFSDFQKCNEGDTREISVFLENNQENEKINSMVVCIVSVPNGLEIDVNYLEELKNAKLFDYFELIGSKEAVFYWKGLMENEKKDFKIRVQAIIPGEYHSKPSRAYLYYDNDKVFFSTLSDLTIQKI